MNNPKDLRILVVDDHPIVRMGLVSLLTTKSGVSATAAESGEAALPLAAKFHPDVVVMDLMMPGIDGVETTRRLLEQDPNTKILILTSFATADGISRALEAGAFGAVTKTTEFSDLIRDIFRVANGERALSDDLSRILSTEEPRPALSPRQFAILQEIADGRANKEIADHLGISLDVVKKHVGAICMKLGAANRSEAVAIALRKHLLKI